VHIRVRGHGKKEIGEKVGRSRGNSEDNFCQTSLECMSYILERCYI
jgi:hypothetical protein